MVQNDLKKKAVELRRKGLSLRVIQERLGISRSTLSIWLRDVELTNEQKAVLKGNWIQGLYLAREKAALANRYQKSLRLKTASELGLGSLSALDLSDKNILKLALAMFFIGEGFKVAEETSLGNSDPASIRAFVKLLDLIYGLDRKKVRVYLHLRDDQDRNKELIFWSKVLEIEPEYFKMASVDKRTIGRSTYEGYHGVCVVRYYDVSIKRELLALARGFFETL